MVTGVDFQKSYCIKAVFDFADLSDSNFQYSNAKLASFQYAKLNNTKFGGANLYKANFYGTGVTESQLQNALALDDVVLSNGTILNTTNLIINGYAECNTSLTNSWTVTIGIISISKCNDDLIDCCFILQSYKTGATMSQRIDTSKKWDPNVWTYSIAVLSARMSPGVHIELKAMKSNGLVSAWETLSKILYIYATNS